MGCNGTNVARYPWWFHPYLLGDPLLHFLNF